MKKIEQQLGGLVTRNLGLGNAFGEFDNADGEALDMNCNDSLGDAYTLDGMKSKLAEMEATQRLKMNARAELIRKESDARIAYNNCENIRNSRDKTACKQSKLPLLQRLEADVATAYTDTQAGGDAITRFKLAYNCKLYKAQKNEEKRVADELARGKVVATDVTLASAKPLPTDRLNNPPVPPKDASADQVKSATITPEGTSTTKKVLFIAGGLLLVAGVILFIRSRRK